MVEQTAKLPMNAVSAVVPTSKSGQPDPALLQAKLMRYADDFFARTSMGTEEYARRVNTPKARFEALSWKVSLDSSALDIATGPNPQANVLDFLALATLSRTFLEARAARAVPHDAFDPWLEDSRVLETNAWQLAEGVLTISQQDEFRAAINRWLANNTGTDRGSSDAHRRWPRASAWPASKPAHLGASSAWWAWTRCPAWTPPCAK